MPNFVDKNVKPHKSIVKLVAVGLTSVTSIILYTSAESQ